MKKVIFHVDVNSAFLSWSALKRLQNGEQDLRLIASCVGGDEQSRHGVVLAKSMVAKRYGVSTGEPIFSARRKCPGLVVVSPDFEWYVKNSRAMFDIFNAFTPDVKAYSIDEGFLDMTGMEKLMGAPLDAAAKLSSRIRGELGFTVNIGISSNYLLAKMASDFEKPDKIHTLFPDEIEEKMWKLPIGDLFGVGRHSVKALQQMGLYTIGDVAKLDRQILVSHFGKYGAQMWDYANGIESVPMVRTETKENSYGNSTTTASDIMMPEDALGILLSLAESVGSRLRLDDKRAQTVTVTLKNSDFKSRSHQCSLPYATNITNVLYETAVQLLYEMWDGNPVRLIGISAGKTFDEAYEQLSLFDTKKAEKLKKLDAAMDDIRSRFGETSVVRARLADKKGHMGLSNAKAKQKKRDERENK